MSKKDKTPKKVAKPTKAKKTERPTRTAERTDEQVHAEREGSKVDEGMAAIGRLVDHPLVADVVAAGAVAAVSAMAEKKFTSTRAASAAGGSRETLKLAGMAAAAAMGKRFMAEVEEMKARRAAEQAERDAADLDGEEE